MAENSGIEWTDATWNPVRGCTRVSEGCRNCYAEVMAARFSDPGQWGHGLAQRVRLPGGGIDHRWTGRVELVPHALDLPLRWRKPRRIFVNSTSDLFHEALPDEAIDEVFAVMALAPHHTFQVLTKRPERARAYLSAAQDRVMTHVADRVCDDDLPVLLSYPPRMVPPDNLAARGKPVIDLTRWPLPNVWIGTSVEDQATADARIPHLLATPAAVRFLSCEPLLGPVDLRGWLPGDDGCEMCDDGEGLPRCLRDDIPREEQCPAKWAVYRQARAGYGDERRHLQWVICGGESGPGARPMHPDWARSLRDQCQTAGVPFFFKQWGEHEADQIGPEDARSVSYPPGHVIFRKVGKASAGRLLDGRTWDEFPGGADA